MHEHACTFVYCVRTHMCIRTHVSANTNVYTHTNEHTNVNKEHAQKWKLVNESVS